VERQDLGALTIIARATCKRVLTLLKADHLKLRKVIVKRVIVVEYGVDDGGGDMILAVVESRKG